MEARRGVRKIGGSLALPKMATITLLSLSLRSLVNSGETPPLGKSPLQDAHVLATCAHDILIVGTEPYASCMGLVCCFD